MVCDHFPPFLEGRTHSFRSTPKMKETWIILVLEDSYFGMIKGALTNRSVFWNSIAFCFRNSERTSKTYQPFLGRFQDFFQGVAEISSGGDENLPGGGKKHMHAIPFSQRFLLFYTTLLIYANFFLHFNTCYREIHKIYFLTIFLVNLLSFIRKFGSPQRPSEISPRS